MASSPPTTTKKPSFPEPTDTPYSPYSDPYESYSYRPGADERDDKFDHQSLSSQSSLVRGATLSRHKSNATSVGRASEAPVNRMSYIDEDPNHDPNKQQDLEAPLVQNAAAPAGMKSFQNLDYDDPYKADRAKPVAEKPSQLKQFFGGVASNARYPLEQRIENKRNGIGRQRYPFVVWALSLAMGGVLINELVVNAREQGSPFSFKPAVNPMLGPSSAVLINQGARFPPCMKLVNDVPPTTRMGCMNNTANPVESICTISELCGFGGLSDPPNQWFRFITAIFLHAGLVHYLLNIFAQMTLSAQIEREMGSGGFLLTYFAAGIFGNVFGGNFSLVGVPSVGASGAIFGTLAVTWVDLFAHWQYHYRPGRRLIFMTIELAIGVAIGFIPYLDNFAHIGGFLMGLFVGMFFYPIISATKRHKTIVWGFRLGALALALVLFVVLIRNFYTSDPYAACSWCRYLSCIPTAANNQCRGTGLTTSSTST